MDPAVKAFLIGYREGREGLPPTASVAMTERELADLEIDGPSLFITHGWMWHLMGWTVGQAIAQNEMAQQ
jgi:hypothetical protein